MADQISVELDNAALQDLLYCEETQDLLGRKARQGAAVARSIVRVDTGELRESIQAEPEEGGGWVFGSDVEHAPFIEEGFRHAGSGEFVGPFPYLRPAVYAIQESE